MHGLSEHADEFDHRVASPTLCGGLSKGAVSILIRTICLEELQARVRD